jgi:hypothetical protein
VTPAPERPDPIYCTGGCDACRDYARELGVPLIVSAAPVTDAGLNVERLARAIANVGKNMRLAASADAIAAEYAALSRQAEKETA